MPMALQWRHFPITIALEPDGIQLDEDALWGVVVVALVVAAVVLIALIRAIRGGGRIPGYNGRYGRCEVRWIELKETRCSRTKSFKGPGLGLFFTL